jgi:dTDP-4-amino-4,6-dideoxygalactose transaminase
VGAKFAVAVSSGTAALHAATAAIGLRPGDEVIVPPLTFPASANCVRYAGGDVLFADVEPATLNIDKESVANSLSPMTRAVIAVDYGGQPVDLAELRTMAEGRNFILIEDAAHSFGAEFMGRRVGTMADMTVFSTHASEAITTGEGGMISTDNPKIAAWLRVFRGHGLRTDAQMRAQRGEWFHSMDFLGYNYRLTDIQCALGISQLRKADIGLERRRQIAATYSEAFIDLFQLELPVVRMDRQSAWHLYPIRIVANRLQAGRNQVFRALRAEGIQVNVHYIPVYWHPYYERLGYRKGLCPAAEEQYERLISLPIWHGMTDKDVTDVIDAVRKVVEAYMR